MWAEFMAPQNNYNSNQSYCIVIVIKALSNRLKYKNMKHLVRKLIGSKYCSAQSTVNKYISIKSCMCLFRCHLPRKFFFENLM